MTDVEEIIDYYKSLKRGFDKTLFQCKIDELAYAVDSVGINYEHFHTLFKVWLNLSIPITKWTSMGACLVPREGVKKQTIEYAMRWLLGTQGVHSDFTKIRFLLDWLTAAMDSDCLDKTVLDGGYEIFYTMLTYEILTAHAMKLVYTLTKPVDVTRRRVLELLDLAKKREAKRSWLRELQVLLGLFKSYKPECVPENIPAISVHTSFRKINESLVNRFKRCQEFRSIQNKETQHLMWTNSLLGTRNKKADPLIPNLEFFNIGSKQYEGKEIPEKTYLDFSDPVSLLQYSLHHTMCRPTRLRALLCNTTGITLLAVATADDHAFLSHDLQHCLASCFLDASPYSTNEKRNFLRRLSVVQRTLCQAIPVVTRFLVQYLPVWNETDYFAEILELVEWTSLECPEHVMYIIESLSRVYHRASPLEKSAILNSLTTMYCNMVFSSTRSRRHFAGPGPINTDYSQILQYVANTITGMCQKAIQTDPDDLRTIHTNLTSCQLMSNAEARYSTTIGSLPGTLALAVPLFTISPSLLDKMADLMMLYKKIYKTMKTKNIPKGDQHNSQIQTLRAYTTDMMNCLYSEVALTNRKSGLVFDKMHPQIVEKLGSFIPSADALFSIRNHLAFAPYTYIQDVDIEDADNKMVLELVRQDFVSLATFLSKIT